MEEFALVEADFQQYYRLNVVELGFLRYARLFANLPPESRIMKSLNPAGDWSWQDETNSRILHELEQISSTLYNTNRKKGAKPSKPGKQFQPEHVEKAKKEYAEWQANKQENEENKTALDKFWRARNPEATFL